jgi:fatty-acyl-CoA synthase
MSTRETLSSWIERARAARRVAFRSGIAYQAHPRGLVELARARLAGPLGISAILRVHAASRPDDPATVFEGRTYTWAETDERVDRLVVGLRERAGLRAGESCAVALRNRPEVLEVQAALSRLGASAVTVSWRSTPAELEYLVTHSGARAVLAEADLDAVAEARPKLERVRAFVSVGGEPERPRREGFLRYEDLLARKPGRRRADASESAVVIYTSGTTGKPKGAVRRFQPDMMWSLLHVFDELPMRVDDRHLAVCPMYHSTAFGFIAFTMTLGGCVVIERGFEPERFLEVVERERITTTAVVPTMLHRLMALPPEVLRRYDTRSLRAIFCGGAPLSGDLARRVIGELGHVLYNFYGSTETGLNTIATPDELLRAPGTIGHAIAENEIRLLDDDGREVRPGETGELFVRNTMLVAGYHADEEATKSSMKGGFFSVGDLAHKDTSGLFHIDGRKRDMIISGGVNVYPAEVEEILHRHPQVSECAVIGVRDEEWGERVCAFVVPREGAFDEADVIAFAKRNLAGPKVPRELRVVSDLPKNPTGKVLKRELRDRA